MLESTIVAQDVFDLDTAAASVKVQLVARLSRRSSSEGAVVGMGPARAFGTGAGAAATSATVKAIRRRTLVVIIANGVRSKVKLKQRTK